MLCVTGMHRSGTSLTMGWLERCGLVTHDGRPMPGRVGNEAGHFEDLDFVEMHERRLLRTHPRSHGWIVTDGGVGFDRFESELLLRYAWRRSKKYDVWGWKDPRTSLFLEQYAWLLPTMKVLIVRRPKHEILDSLVRRSAKTDVDMAKIDRATAAAVHDHYVQQLERFARRHRRRTLTLALNDIVDDDVSAFAQVNGLLKGRLTYVPLADGFAPTALHRE